jgi:phytoene dehydrogenase-like protein
MPSSDVLVIGGGLNGLACAARLARAGRQVTVLEAADAPGGGAVAFEFSPGFRAPALAHLLHGLDPRLTADLGLFAQGLRYLAEDIGTTSLSAVGERLEVDGPRAGGPDAAKWAALHGRLAALAAALAPFRQIAPPRLSREGNDWTRLARLGLGLRRLGTAEFRALGRLILSNAADLAEDELGDPRLQGLVAFDATLGAWTGPRSPNSLILYLDRLARGPLALPQGGLAAVTAAAAAAAVGAGAVIRTGARVAAIATDGDRATGVTLAGGETLTASLVVSTVPPGTTFRRLLGPRALDAGFYTRTGHIRARGAAAKLALALSGAPALGPDLRRRFVIAPSVDAVENAWNPVKYGEVPARPVMEFILPSAFEPGWAPAGRHVLSAIVQFAPHAPADRAAAKAAFLKAVHATLEAHVPGIGALVLATHLRMPWEIEDAFGLPCWHAAELSVEQMLFNRPIREAAQYATPLPGLWLAGAGSHPGGGVTGTPGWNAAGRILEAGA